MIKQLTLSTIAILTLFLAASTHAQNRAGSATLTLGVGDYIFDSKRHIENTPIPFIALGFNFSDHWGIEGLFGKFITEFDNNIPDDRQINGNLFAVDAVFRFCPYKRIQPFITAGVGILGMNPNGNDAGNEGNINAGIGFQWFADELVALRVEARDFYTIIGGKNDYFIDAGVTFFLNFC